MLAIDTNLLFFAFAQDRPEHRMAQAWITPLHGNPDVMVSEFVLVEFYRLIRNPAVCRRPLSAPEAADTVSRYRRHPVWRVVGFNAESLAVHDDLWRFAAQPRIPYRRIFDARLALSLLRHGATRLATANVGDFQGLGFLEVFNPIAPAGGGSFSGPDPAPER